MTSRHGVATSSAPTAEEATFRKLKPGPGQSRDAVAIDQKLRLRLALSSITAEVGFEAVTVRALLRRARISTSTFYGHYQGLEDCFADVVGTSVRGVVDDITRAQELSLDPIGGLRTALHFWMERLALEPTVTEAVFVESAAAGPRVLGEMKSALGAVEALLSLTLDAAPRPAAGPRHLAGGLVAGLVGIVRRTALAGRAAQLPDLADELADWMLAVAHEEVAAFCAPRSRRPGDPLPPTGLESGLRSPTADAGQRAMTTAIRLVVATGPAGLTSAKIRKDAGLTRREFEARFTGVEDCYLEAIESVSAIFADAARRSAGEVENWERWIFRLISALCALAAVDRGLSRLVLLDLTAVGRAGLLRREELIDRGAAYIRDRAAPERRPSELAAIASLSAIWRIAETEVAARRDAQLPRVAPAFAYVILAPRRRPGAAKPALVPELRLASGEIEASPLAAATA